MTNILLIEDDERLADLIQEYLQKNKLEVSIESRGDRAVKRIFDECPDLIVLDLMLPGLDGLEICRQIRPKYSNPILMLTAKGDDIDQVVGLEIGADDYVPKPVQPRVLLARIRALLRRVPCDTIKKLQSTNAELVYGNIRMNKSNFEVYVDNKMIDLSNMEFELLWLLASNAGTVMTRDDILGALRGIGYDGQNRSTDITISRLRKKIGDDHQPAKIIKTIHRKGYLFSADGGQ